MRRFLRRRAGWPDTRARTPRCAFAARIPEQFQIAFGLIAKLPKARALQVRSKKMRLLVEGHEDIWMPLQIFVQRGRATFGRANDKEIGHCFVRGCPAMRDGLQSLHSGPSNLLNRHDRIIVQFTDVDSLSGRDDGVADAAGNSTRPARDSTDAWEICYAIGWCAKPCFGRPECPKKSRMLPKNRNA